jgi:hypothetical protein
MQTTEHPISTAKIVRRAIGLPVYFSLFMIGLYLLEKIFKIDLYELLKGKKTAGKDFHFWLATVVTLLCIPWALIAGRTALRLARHGVVVQATLTSLGLHKAGMTACSYSYDYNGRTFSNRVDMGDDEAHAIGIGGQFPILVDPASPGRSKPRSDIFPE